MTAKNYEGTRELKVQEEVMESFQKAVKDLKLTIAQFGFSEQAVENLEFTLQEYAINLGEEERRSGAYHYFADGKPFYEMHIKAPGSIMDLANSEDKSLLSKDAKVQGLTLFFELSMNVVPIMKQWMRAKNGTDEADVHSGGSMPFNEANFDTTFRCDPAEYVQAFEQLVCARLSALLKQDKGQQPKPKAPRP